jgi:hypothetical protein
LHHNFVVALLNDLFGIQARGGCSCAGPYGHRLLGIDLETSRAFESEIVAGCEGIKPGWVRINFNYFLSEDVFEFLLEAVNWVSTEGWKLLPHYEFHPDTGRWVNQRQRQDSTLRLEELSYATGRLTYPGRRKTEPMSALKRYLEDAPRIVEQALREYRELPAPKPVTVTRDFESLRWFPLPAECLTELLGGVEPKGGSDVIRPRE